MQTKELSVNLPVTVAITGIAFLAGGMIRTLLLQLLFQSGNETGLLQIIPVVWLGFILEAAIGMAVLAYLLRNEYSFQRLWLAGIKAFAAGSLIPAILMSQYFYLLIMLTGILTGLALEKFLDEKTNKGRLPYWVALGFFIPQLIIYYAPIDYSWLIRLSDISGFSRTTLLYLLADLFIGFFVALGIIMMLRRKYSTPVVT